ncbi:MAG: hypothetical protein NC417_04475 [Candidatus Gastranaerophilales bacterium]|nr:hypothetical protein [Candidatus Gastranaerophilales bacterium]
MKKREQKTMQKRRMRQCLAVLLAVFLAMPEVPASAAETEVQENPTEIVAEDAAGEDAAGEEPAKTEALEETAGDDSERTVGEAEEPEAGDEQIEAYAEDIAKRIKT